jgi:PhoH-like ATPase
MPVHIDLSVTEHILAPAESDTRRCVVLDTSVLVADPEALHGFPGCDVVLPLTVVEELDGLKSRRDEVGWLARSALRAIERHRMAAGGSLADGCPLRDDSTLRVEVNGIQKHLLIEHGLDPEKADNRIIGAALGQSSHRRVTVVSNDAAFRIKAAHLGLEAVEHHTIDLDRHGPGWVTVDVDGTIIDDLYAGRDVATADVEAACGSALVTNTFVALRSGSSSVLARVRESGAMSRLPGGTPQVWGLRPRNKEQRFALELLMDPDIKVVALDGQAGTGKTLVAIAAALEQVVEQRTYQRLQVFKPLVPVGGEEIGFLPGDLSMKIQPYFAAVGDAIAALTEGRSVKDADRIIEQLLHNGQMTLEPITFLRGRSLANSIILVDESTNLERAILKTLLTRVADGTKIVFTGDVSQIDNPFASSSNNALTALIDAFAGQPFFGHVRLTSCERSDVAETAAKLL